MVKETPVATPTPVAAALSDTWTDQSGYSYRLALTPEAPEVSIDVADAAPNSALLKVSYSLTGKLVNGTVGHNAPFPNYILVMPLWLNGSAACGVNNVSNINYNPDGTDASTQVCEIGAEGTQAGLGPAGSSANASEILVGKSVNVTVGASWNLTVAQDQAKSLAAVFSTPDVYALARNTGTVSTDCLAESGGYYISAWTKPTGCTPSS